MWIQLKRHFEARSLEWFSGCMLSAWGAYLILYPTVFDGPASPFFRVLKDFAHQEVWGFSAFLIGSVRLTALFINGRWGVTPMVRVLTSFLSVFVWFWVSFGLLRTSIPNPGLIIYPGLVLADMMSASRAAGDAYEVEAHRRLKELSEKPSNVTRFG